MLLSLPHKLYCDNDYHHISYPTQYIPTVWTMKNSVSELDIVIVHLPKTYKYMVREFQLCLFTDKAESRLSSYGPNLHKTVETCATVNIITPFFYSLSLTPVTINNTTLFHCS
jgi:hypothetical protein